MKKKLHKTYRQMMSGSMKVAALIFAMTTLFSMQVLAIDYPIKIAGVTVTDANKNDVQNNGGSVKYDPATQTITLDNATINGGTGSVISISVANSTGDYTISLIGDNTIYSGDRAIYGKCSSLTIQGIDDGSLTMSFLTVPDIGIHAYDADLIIKDCNIYAIATQSVIAGNSAAAKTITIDNANVETHSTGTDVDPISGFGTMVLTRCKMTLPVSGTYTNNQIQVGGTAYYGNVKIIRVYLQVGGVDVTEDNKNAVPILSGSAIYNSDTRTLELEDADQGTQVHANNTHGVYISAPAENGVEYTIHGDVWQADYFLIEAVGQGTYDGIYSLANLKLQGYLEIDAPYYGISMGTSASLTIQDAGIKVSPGERGISGNGGDLIIRNSDVIITSGGVSGFTNIYFFGSYIDSPVGAVREDGAIKLDGNLYTGEIVIKKSPVGVDLKEAAVNNAWASSGTLYIEYNQGTKATAEVFSLIGAKVANISLNTGINSQAMDRGIYIVRIGNETHKVIVN